jgi:hypothetical protein
MKIISNFLICALLLVCVKTEAQTVYHNDFTERSDWKSKYTSSVWVTNTSILNGYLILNPNRIEDLFRNFPDVSIDFAKDFTIETSIATYSNSSYCQIMLGVSSNFSHHIYFKIDADGYSGIGSYTGEYKDLVEFQRFSGIKTGSGVFNKILITKKGSQIFFYINDLEFARLSNVEMYGNNIGFGASKGTSVEVDYLTIKYGADQQQSTPVKKEFTEGEYVNDKYKIKVSKKNDNLMLIEPNLTSTYVYVGDDLYEYQHSSGSVYYIKVIDNSTIETSKKGGASPTIFSLSKQPNAEKRVTENVAVNKPSDETPPQISITSPGVKRGLMVTETNKKITITGKATDQSGIYEVMVNGIEAKVDASGNFSATVPLAIGENNFTVTATDIKMNKGDYSFTVSRTPAENIETPIIPVANTEMTQGGKYYALIIGIEDYQDPTIPDLEEPVGDASSLSNILNTKYTFDKENIKLLKNPTRYQVFQALEALSKKVKESDNLLIFYAGHGYWDEQRKQGYWFPSDGKKADRSSWVTNADLKEYISTIPSKHTLLITDACFAGSIFKSRSIVSSASMAVKQLYELPSRKAMTSGSLKEVPDKSVFIEYLVKRLNQNSEKFLSAEQLFSSFRTAVINNSANGQVPQYGEIKEAGDEGGDFIFIKR